MLDVAVDGNAWPTVRMNEESPVPCSQNTLAGRTATSSAPLQSNHISSDVSSDASASLFTVASPSPDCNGGLGAGPVALLSAKVYHRLARFCRFESFPTTHEPERGVVSNET